MRPGQSNIIKCPFHAYLFLTYSWAELCLDEKIEYTINFEWLTPRHDSNRVCRTLWATQLISDTPSALIRPANLTATACCIDSSSCSFGSSSSGIRSRLANYYYKPKWRWRCHRRGEKVLMIRPGTTWGAINHSRRHAPASHPLTVSLPLFSLPVECHLAFMACGRRQTAHVQLFYTICGACQLLLYDVPQLLLLLLLPLLRQFGVL